jgi:hypothetical protein
VGRESATLDGWRAIVVAVRKRANNKCEVGGWDHPGTDPDHVVNRSQGSEDSVNGTILLCRSHHNMKTNVYVKGRLLITADGQGGFTWRIEKKANKQAIEVQVLSAGTICPPSTPTS